MMMIYMLSHCYMLSQIQVHVGWREGEFCLFSQNYFFVLCEGSCVMFRRNYICYIMFDLIFESIGYMDDLSCQGSL